MITSITASAIASTFKRRGCLTRHGRRVGMQRLDPLFHRLLREGGIEDRQLREVRSRSACAGAFLSR